jgi:hypothetical protein
MLEDERASGPSFFNLANGFPAKRHPCKPILELTHGKSIAAPCYRESHGIQH